MMTGDDDTPCSPRPLLLEPVHLRFYGVDALLSVPTAPASRTVDRPGPSTDDSKLAPSVADTTPEIVTDGGVAAAAATTTTTPLETNASGPLLDAGQAEPAREAPQLSRAIEAAATGASPTSSAMGRRRRLPLSPPNLSARCQVHPAVMPGLGVSPGDAVLVVVLAEGWFCRASVADGQGGGTRGTDGGGAGGCSEMSDTPDGSAGESTDGVRATVAAEEALEERRDGFESFSLITPEKQLHHQQLQQQQRQQQLHEMPPIENARVRCLLCTVWANPHLSTTKTAVDGRVNIPLTPSDYNPAPHHTPPHQPWIEPKPPARQAEHTYRSGVPLHDDLDTDGLISGFLREATRRHESSVGGRGRGGAVVGIIPLCKGGGGVSAGGVLVAERISARVLLRRPKGNRRRGDDRAAVVDAAGLTVTGSSSATAAATGSLEASGARRGEPLPEEEEDEIATATERTSSRWRPSPPPPSSSSPVLSSSAVLGNLPRRAVRGASGVALPPEYTSMVKRSLRHVVVSEGCEVAVPDCPMTTAAFGGGSIGFGDEGGGRGRGSGRGASGSDCNSDCAVAHIIINGSFDGDRVVGMGFPSPSKASSLPSSSYVVSPGEDGGFRSGALALLLRGAVCAVGADSAVLVEDGVDVPVVPQGLQWRGRGRAWGKGNGVGGGEKHGAGDVINRRVEGRESGGAKRTPRTTTDALVELMMLPMTADAPPRGDLTPLEFLIPRGVLLTGPPGVGKTFAVRSAVEAVRDVSDHDGTHIFQVQLTTLNGAEILSLGQWEACEALREACSAAESWSQGRAKSKRHGFPLEGCKRCAVIFLDEADALLTRRDRDGDKAGGGEGAQALAQLLTLMDGFHRKEGSHVIIIGATNRPGALDPALRRPGRFDREIALAPPDLRARADILGHHLRRVKVAGGEETLLATATKCVGYVGADLAALAREAILLRAARLQGERTGGRLQPSLSAGKRRDTGTFCVEGKRGRHQEQQQVEEAVVGVADLVEAMEKVGASSLRGHQVTVPDTPWSDIGGMEEAKAKLRQAVEWPVANKAAFERMGLTPPRGILLFGPPGCSKTTLVRAAATAAGATFVCLSGADVFSPYLGEAEAAVRKAFLLARNAAPALLFFDEIDAIVVKREDGGKASSGSAESRVLATFLTEMDGVGSLKGDGVIVVGATNRPEAVDNALLRPGRFDQVVYAPLPSEDARRQIFEVHTRKMAVETGLDFHVLAGVSKGLTGAEIEGVCREAAMSALRETGFGGNDNEDLKGNAVGDSSKCDIGCDKDNRSAKEPTVTMHHLLAAATVAAARPGVTVEMIAGYDRFASGL